MEVEQAELEFVERNKDGTITLHLEVSVSMPKRPPVSELTFRRPRGKDLRDADNHRGGDVEKSYVLAASLSGQSWALFDEMDYTDVERAMGVVEELTGRGKSTAGKAF